MHISAMLPLAPGSTRCMMCSKKVGVASVDMSNQWRNRSRGQHFVIWSCGSILLQTNNECTNTNNDVLQTKQTMISHHNTRGERKTKKNTTKCLIRNMINYNQHLKLGHFGRAKRCMRCNAYTGIQWKFLEEFHCVTVELINWHDEVLRVLLILSMNPRECFSFSIAL